MSPSFKGLERENGARVKLTDTIFYFFGVGGHCPTSNF